MCEGFLFCPICQLPLKAISISADAHVSQCMTRYAANDADNEECAKGLHCLSTDVFHYRDFSHRLLATYRASRDFVPPEVDIVKPSPNNRATPKKTRKPRKSRTPSKFVQKGSTTTDSDESPNLLQIKKAKRTLKLSESEDETKFTSKKSESPVKEDIPTAQINLSQHEELELISSRPSSPLLAITENKGQSSPSIRSELVTSDPPSSPEVVINKGQSSPSIRSELVTSDPPSSPEVVIPLPLTKINRNQTFLSSSSDSDLPLAFLVKNCHVNTTTNKSKSKTCLNGTIKRKSSDSSKNTSSESESVKSLGTKDGSFVPSERSSTQNSDFVFSAESTENLSASSKLSSSVSSESFNSSSYLSYLSDDKRTKPRTPKGRRKSGPVAFLSSASGDSDASRTKLPIIQRNSEFGDHKCVNNSKAEWDTILKRMRDRGFPTDLKVDSEDTLTITSSCSSTDTSDVSLKIPLKRCPDYKKVPDTPFVVDAFEYWRVAGVKVYFLSHFHYDHYIGLKKGFPHPIYCSQITANLLLLKLRLDKKSLNIIELNQPRMINGVEVTALDANHCPGAVMLLFRLSNGRNYLHVGDFRGSRKMTFYPELQKISITTLFLDTTFCDPKYQFPSQQEVIEQAVRWVQQLTGFAPNTLVVCGTYTIGKEKVFMGIAEAMDWLVWARPDKQKVLQCLNDHRINRRITTNPLSANVHVLPMQSITLKRLKDHAALYSGRFTHVIGLRPTGWEATDSSRHWTKAKQCKENITIYGLPYSEHSDFSELRDFVHFLQPHNVVPTVGGVSTRSQMFKYFSDWLKPKQSPSTGQTKMSEFLKRSR